MKTTITRIFLDLDDVLNCFTMAALEYVGCPVKSHDDRTYDTECGWDIVKAANTLHLTREFTTTSFWKSIDRDFWATVPRSREFTAILQASEGLVGTENICILSSPTLDPDCLAGKAEWIRDMMPSRFNRQFLIGPKKQFCARPDALLIDDRDLNIEEFKRHEGNAILMPRPWNSLHHITNPLRHIINAMVYFFGLEPHPITPEVEKYLASLCKSSVGS